MANPLISVCIPIHDMPKTAYFLARLLTSLDKQTYKNYEIVITKEGSMPVNSNAAIKKAKGEIIKMLYMDDYLEPEALANIARNFKGGWLATGCTHTFGETTNMNPHLPTWIEGHSEEINTIGSPSVVAFENKKPLLFDTNLSWMLDVELYGRLYKRYGPPTLLNTLDVVIGLHEGQMTHILSTEEKETEVNYLNEKLYGTN